MSCVCVCVCVCVVCVRAVTAEAVIVIRTKQINSRLEPPPCDGGGGAVGAPLAPRDPGVYDQTDINSVATPFSAQAMNRSIIHWTHSHLPELKWQQLK